MRNMAKTLSPEETVLVLSARLHLNEENAKAFGQVLEGGLDWERVVAMGERLGCLPLLYRHLSQPRWSRMAPRGVQETLGQAYRKAAFRSLRIQGQIQKISDETEKRHSPVLFLKGAALAGWVYEDIGLRPMNDIDVLVKKVDVPRLDRMLRDMGYEQDAYRSHVHRKMALVISHLPAYRKVNRLTVEVHVSLFDNPAMEMGLWKKVHAPGDGNGLRVLPLEWLLVHLCVHLEKHLGGAGVTLYWFSDIFEFIRKCSDALNWLEFERLVDGLGVRNQVLRIIGILRTWWDLDVPQGLAQWNLDAFADEHLALDRHTAREAWLQNLLTKKGHLFQKVYAEHGLVAAWYYGFRILFPPKRYVLNLCNETSRTRFFGIYLMYSWERLRNAGMGVWSHWTKRRSV